MSANKERGMLRKREEKNIYC